MIWELKQNDKQLLLSLYKVTSINLVFLNHTPYHKLKILRKISYTNLFEYFVETSCIYNMFTYQHLVLQVHQMVHPFFSSYNENKWLQILYTYYLFIV